MNINVGAHYVPGYNTRLDEIEDVRTAAHADLVFTTESGTYANAEKLSKFLGWGGDAFVLHGGSMPITTAAHWNPHVWKLKAEWGHSDKSPIITLPGSTHRWATAVLLEQVSSGGLLLAGITHCVPWPKGPNTIRKYNEQRAAEFGGLLDWLEETGDNLGVPARIATGDLNGIRTDTKYPGGDGPGKAMAKYGYKDAAVIAETSGGPNRALIDRFAVKGLSIAKHTVLPTNGATDHDHAAAIRTA